MIDSHCHLTDKQFAEDRDAVIRRAVAAGVVRMVTIADSLEESEQCVSLTEKYEHIFCSIGVHPHNAMKWRMTNDQSLMTTLRGLVASSKKVVALGETGLDYHVKPVAGSGHVARHYDFSPRDAQRQAFQEQLELAKELRLPAVVHCREAVTDVWATVDAVRPEELVLHCCTEKWEDVRRFVDRGYFLSFTGIATYPQSEDVRRTIRMCPLEQMMVETDAPYLAPVPYRGKRNEPAYVMEVAKAIAQMKGVTLEEVDRVTTGNAMRFFHIPGHMDSIEQ